MEIEFADAHSGEIIDHFRDFRDIGGVQGKSHFGAPVFRTLLAAIAVQNVAAECLNIAKQPPRAA